MSRTLQEAARAMPPLDRQPRFVDGKFLPPGAWVHVDGAGALRQKPPPPGHRHAWAILEAAADRAQAFGDKVACECGAVAEWRQVDLGWEPEDPTVGELLFARVRPALEWLSCHLIEPPILRLDRRLDRWIQRLEARRRLRQVARDLGRMVRDGELVAEPPAPRVLRVKVPDWTAWPEQTRRVISGAAASVRPPRPPYFDPWVRA